MRKRCWNAKCHEFTLPTSRAIYVKRLKQVRFISSPFSKQPTSPLGRRAKPKGSFAARFKLKPRNGPFFPLPAMVRRAAKLIKEKPAVDPCVNLFLGPSFVQGCTLNFVLMGSRGTKLLPGIQATPAAGAKVINLAFGWNHRLAAMGASCYVAWVSAHFTLSRTGRGKWSLLLKSHSARKTGREFQKLF